MCLSSDPENFENLSDETEDLQALTFDDLLSFAFQVAKGMEFLSSKNVRDEGPHCKLIYICTTHTLRRHTETQLMPLCALMVQIDEHN